jgi:hypothetical protein
MNAVAFNALPYLLRLREVVGCGLSEADVRWMARAGQLQAVPLGGPEAPHQLYARASVAPVVGLAMDWSRLEGWPALLMRYHLLAAGLRDENIAVLVARGILAPRAGHRPARYEKWQLKGLVGYPQAEISDLKAVAGAALPRKLFGCPGN